MQKYKTISEDIIAEVRPFFEGDIFTDHYTRVQYATDASAYRVIPHAVTRPKTVYDLKLLVAFAKKHNSSLIPRTAGTSLAGQVVGEGIIVDFSKYFTKVIEINKEERWVRVQPGVIPDELNLMLKPEGLFFGPETSTSNRCMIGGMVGNNSCGTHSLIYGSTRDHLLSVKMILSDANEVEFGALSREEFQKKCELETLEGEIYQNINEILSNEKNQQLIRSEFPDPELKRRNTGYALDLLLETEPFTGTKEKFNFSTLIAGSEGTLGLVTEIKLNLLPLPPPVKGLVCVHCKTIEDAVNGNLTALKYNPGAIELMDSVIMEQSKSNIELRKKRFFIEGEPGAMLLVEFARNSMEEILSVSSAMEKEMRALGLGYHFPVLFGKDINDVWDVRRAGLGILSNIPGDAKPVPVVEDTAVKPGLLPAYIADFNKLLKKHNLDCVYYAHIATGELHLRPVLNLKDPKDVELFRTIGLETARLVKKYNGSLSGEHGDGRLRSEFISIIVGEKIAALFWKMKLVWDPERIFNQGKITEPPKMNEHLRFEPGQPAKEIKTLFDFSADLGYLRAVEKCNGSGDCLKPEIFGGLMCPSYQATRDENNSTRARANILREYITTSKKTNPFTHKEIIKVLDLCLSCKGCKSECPSSVDMTKLKAEALQHYYDDNKIPLRTKLIAHIHKVNNLGSVMPHIFNFFITNSFTSGLLKRFLGFAPKRTIPKLYKFTMSSWLRKTGNGYKTGNRKNGKVFLFIDEFTEYNDTLIGIKAVKLLRELGYEVEVPKHTISGRALLSKGLVREAKEIAIENVNLLKDIISEDMPLIGIEPSAILTFRDEYPELVGDGLKEDALRLSKSVFMFDEFIVREAEKGKIIPGMFTEKPVTIKLHGHCHQKAIASTEPTKKMLSLPVNYNVEEIKSGCCGMAGSFGFEKEHYDLSMKIGEMILFPEIRKTDKSVIIAAPGTSCRHQIKDGTGRRSLHPVEILFEAIVKR